jgi:hypothetical protein
MPFAENTFGLLGKRLHIEPHYGNGWMLCRVGGAFDPLDTPASFDVDLVEVLPRQERPEVLICSLHEPPGKCELQWVAVLARSDAAVDLTREKTSCNLLLSTDRPSLVSSIPSWHPNFVVSNAERYVRGFGVVSMSAISGLP